MWNAQFTQTKQNNKSNIKIRQRSRKQQDKNQAHKKQIQASNPFYKPVATSKWIREELVVDTHTLMSLQDLNNLVIMTK